MIVLGGYYILYTYTNAWRLRPLFITSVDKPEIDGGIRLQARLLCTLSMPDLLAYLNNKCLLFSALLTLA